MTHRSVSWTDAESVAQLLARATGPKRTVPGGAVARLAPAMPAAATVAKPRLASVPPVAGAGARGVEASAAVPRLQQYSDNPSDRLDLLLAWTLDHQRCTGAFIADDNGLTLAAHGISEAHVSLVGPLLSALLAVRSIPGVDATAGALWLGTNMMSWVEARTHRGGFCLGTVGPEALSTQALEQLKDALETTVRGL
ncbi:MAG: hypothetical protein ABUL60_15510 [Myxococcales bacterium]